MEKISANVKITSIKVIGLFDRFDYDIVVNNTDNVSILSGPNGCGKTTIFKLLNFIFNPENSTMEEILGVPFSRFECQLSNGKTVALARKNLGASEQKEAESTYFLSIEENGKPLKQVSFSESSTSSREEIGKLGLHHVRKAFVDFNSLLSSMHCNIHIGFIEADRLQKFEGIIEPLQMHHEKMKLFTDIFNKHNEITGKSILFTPNGIKIMSGNNEINFNCLSSGEKNDFIMFYRLIFNTTKDSIVLIDEPERSLHIEWQEDYLDHLINICDMNGLQAIVATHSPNIVNDHFNLFVEKK